MINMAPYYGQTMSSVVSKPEKFNRFLVELVCKAVDALIMHCLADLKPLLVFLLDLMRQVGANSRNFLKFSIKSLWSLDTIEVISCV